MTFSDKDVPLFFNKPEIVEILSILVKKKVKVVLQLEDILDLSHEVIDRTFLKVLFGNQ